MWRAFLRWLALGTICGVVGCGGQRRGVEPQPGAVATTQPSAAVDARAERVARDPLGYLREVAARTRTLRQYTLTFIRTERRGFFNRLEGPEHVACSFRRIPFSVRMRWTDEDIKYGESTFVAGEQGNKVRFITRRWSPPLLPPPHVNRVEVQTPVRFGETKWPVTDFGLEKLIDRTLSSIAQAGENVVLSYRGLAGLPEGGQTVHHLHLEYSPALYKVCTQDLYIDLETDLPAGTVLRYADGELDSSYFYLDVDTTVRLTDDDFLLEPERKQRDRERARARGAD